MVVKWEGGAPPDANEWVDVLSKALGQESGFYWVRFYRRPGGWRFDLERRAEAGADALSSYLRADESAVHRAFTSLAGSGKRIDPSWAPSPEAGAGSVRTPRPAPAEPAGTASARDRQRSVPPAAARAAQAGPNPTSVLYPDSDPQTQPPGSLAAGRPAGRRGLRLVLVAAPVLLLVALAAWLFRDDLLGLLGPAGPLPAPSPPAAPTEEAPAGREKPEATTPPSPESAPSPAPSPAARSPQPPGPVGETQPETKQRPATPAPTPRPAAPPPMPRRGESAEANEPGLTPPVVVSQSCPEYPPRALERRLSGTVWLTALVDETGAVVEVSRVRASPPGVGFEDAGTRCVLSRVYRPASRQGVPVKARVPIRIEFHPPGG